jgi:hydrogenase-4 membrane subunit HyfE
MLMINGLACLLIITSLCVIMVRTAKKAALFYSLQSLVLVLLFVTPQAKLASDIAKGAINNAIIHCSYIALPLQTHKLFCI